MKKITLIASILFLTFSLASFAQKKQEEAKKETTIKTNSKTTKEDGKVTEDRKVTEAEIDGKHVKYVKENGELTALTIDGKRIEKENFKDYKDLISKIEKEKKKEPHHHDPNVPHKH